MAYINPNSLTNASSPLTPEQLRSKSPKFVRSQDRCNILTRTPVFDRKANLLCYVFRYTAGESSFRPDMIEKKHVRHISIGFYTRRHSELFTQRNGICMTEFPLCPDLSKYARALPATRFILHLQDRQDSAISFLHQLNLLKKESMTIAADVYTIVYTNWFKEIRSISYAVIDMTQDIEEQFILARNILKKAPWIKIICDRCDNVNKASIAFESGADYVCCPAFPKDVLQQSFNPYFYRVNRNSFEICLRVIEQLLEEKPEYKMFVSFISTRNDIKSYMSIILHYLEQGRENEYLLGSDFESFLYEMDVEVLNKLVYIMILMILEEFYRPDVDKNKGKYILFEPLRQLLLRAKFIEELTFYHAGSIDVSWGFSLGIGSLISHMYAFTTSKVDMLIEQIDSRIKKIMHDIPEYETIYKIAVSMESLDLEFVDGIMASGFMTRHDILMAYETAVMWVAGLEEAINQRRF